MVISAEHTVNQNIDVSDTCCIEGSGPVVSADEAESYALLFRALADPTRIRILNMLAHRDDAVCVCEIVDWFRLGQSTISHHLKLLRDARFVTSERRGTFMYYQLNSASMQAFPLVTQRILNTQNS